MVFNKYQKENLPNNTGLVDNSLIIRKHNEKDCILLMEKWWNEIKIYSYRDQLSFNYIMWKTGIKNKYISKSFIQNYFSQSAHLVKKN